ncbi:MAG: hypothetical protein KDK78_06305 [Chlamydiia bacterium]|nr:hypothetical protein [Chlamydiia bacterium]
MKLTPIFVALGTICCWTVKAEVLLPQTYHSVEALMDDGKYLLLEDGTFWLIRRFLKESRSIVEKPYQERVMLWGEGARVKVLKRIGMHEREHSFGLWNQEAPAARAYVVAELVDVPDNQGCYLAIASVSGGGRYFTLTDGSQWTVGWWQSWWSCAWKAGDQVYCAYEFADSATPSFLINVSRKNEFVQGSPLGHL